MRTGPRNLQPALLLCAAALAAASLAACGGGEPATGASQDQPRADVTRAQIEAQSSGSPRRTVLEWWREFQLNDPEAARRLYLEPPSLADLAGQFNYVGDRLAGRVELASTRKEGDGVVVRARWTRPSQRPRQVSIRLARAGDAWKLTEVRFVNELVARLQAAEVEG